MKAGPSLEMFLQQSAAKDGARERASSIVPKGNFPEISTYAVIPADHISALKDKFCSGAVYNALPTSLGRETDFSPAGRIEARPKSASLIRLLFGPQHKIFSGLTSP
mmetsp:Transcript_15039/g.31622  ORF Transcript_15039/g.31622 Transcript_15039/m.31622 type:complete len:107 (+) Transcript_15039:625-945(+)